MEENVVNMMEMCCLLYVWLCVEFEEGHSRLTAPHSLMLSFAAIFVSLWICNIYVSSGRKSISSSLSIFDSFSILCRHKLKICKDSGG